MDVQISYSQHTNSPSLSTYKRVTPSSGNTHCSSPTALTFEEIHFEELVLEHVWRREVEFGLE